MRTYSIFILLPLVLPCLALPSGDCEHKVKEIISPPPGWTIHGPAPLDHLIKLRIGLLQPNFHVLEEHLNDISDPYNERYGAYLSKEEVEELVTPHSESVESVNQWLSSHGIRDEEIIRSPAGDWLTLRVPVQLVEKILNTKYYVWTKNGEYLVRTTSYSLPTNLHEHIELIQPTTMFGTFKKLSPTPEFVPRVTVDASCNTTITITCLKQIYNAVGYTPSAREFANRADLQTFYADQVPAAAAVNVSFEFVSVKGGLDSQNASLAGGEANLDVQFAFGLSFPIKSTFYSTAGRPPFIPDIGTPTDTNEPYTDWLDFMMAHPNPPLAISTSYGDDEQTVPESFARRACAGFAQLGVRGVSLMFSSGDGGVGDGDPNPATQECITNDGLNRVRPSFVFYTTVTAVGGTIHFPETAVAFSGGGFSNYFSRPAYQDKAVEAFLGALPKGTYSGLFNPNGRAFPDVAAQSDFFRVFIGGRAFHIGGTSASSPTFAGFVALLNDGRLKKGLPLWAASGFNDITVGNNPGCGTPGFNATKGWDAVTGLGTPDFGKLLKLVT
ncbi:tripeptidyl peptidase A [Mycena sp. CBHHK59/15]|nr:tripeptidyl peptidase A [Mycena sp. CBHHK59/15]